MRPYPDDADALRRVADGGSDMSRPVRVDFQVAVPDEAAASVLAIAAERLGYRARTFDRPGCSLPWTCECSLHMVATYKRVVAVQKELAELGARYGSHPDGWRTSGNVAERPNGGWEPGCGSEVSLEPSG